MRRTRILLAGVCSAAMMAAACSGGSGGAKELDESAPVTLTWWTGQSADQQKQLEKLAREFEKKHDNVTIKLSSGASTTDDLLQKLAAGFASNNYPDISYAYGSWAGELEASNRTLDITDKVKDPEVKWDEFPEVGRLTASPKGRTIGFPALVDNLVLMYNKTLFADAGVAEPTKDWTWDDFRSAAAKITDKDKKIFGTGYPVSGGEDTTWHLWPLLWQKGGEILSDEETKPAFNSEAGAEALGFLSDVAKDGSMYLDQTDEKYGQLFVSGRIGMIISGPWMFYDLAQTDTDYGVSPLPGFDGNHTTVAGPDLWVLFDQKDANRAHWAYEFTKWLTSPEQDVRFNVANGNTPLRASEAETPEYKKLAADYPGIDTVLANFDNATKARPTIQAYVALSKAVGDAIAKVLQDGSDPAKALDEAAEQAQDALKRSAR